MSSRLSVYGTRGPIIPFVRNKAITSTSSHYTKRHHRGAMRLFFYFFIRNANNFVGRSPFQFSRRRTSGDRFLLFPWERSITPIHFNVHLFRWVKRTTFRGRQKGCFLVHHFRQMQYDFNENTRKGMEFLKGRRRFEKNERKSVSFSVKPRTYRHARGNKFPTSQETFRSSVFSQLSYATHE